MDRASQSASEMHMKDRVYEIILHEGDHYFGICMGTSDSYPFGPSDGYLRFWVFVDSATCNANDLKELSGGSAGALAASKDEVVIIRPLSFFGEVTVECGEIVVDLEEDDRFERMIREATAAAEEILSAVPEK